MAEMEKRFPGSREKSVFACVELSLRRLSEVNRDRVRMLAVFHGSVNLDVLRTVISSEGPRWTEWLPRLWREKPKRKPEVLDLTSLANELVETGLAMPNRYNHLTLNPALCPYLREQMDAVEREVLTVRWIKAMNSYVNSLVQQHHQDCEIAAIQTRLELPNLFALLDLVQVDRNSKATIALSTSLFTLLLMAGKPRLLKRVGQVRDTAAAALDDGWNHARFQAARTLIEQQIVGGKLSEALDGTHLLLQRARVAGQQGYPDADYDLAMAHWMMGKALRFVGRSKQALQHSEEARRRFDAVEQRLPGCGAERMASVCISERANCLFDLGRLDEAASDNEQAIRYDELRDDYRGVAVGKGQLGDVRAEQCRYQEALAAYANARERFTSIGELGEVARIWHGIGIVYHMTGQPDAAEDAFRKSLTIKVHLGNTLGRAITLQQLGLLYDQVLGRFEEAVVFFRQAVDKCAEIDAVEPEGRIRSNLADSLRKLHRFEEARREISRAIICKGPFGHVAKPWKTWSILTDIETEAGNPAAAAEAKRKAITCYDAYLRDGGEDHDDGRISLL